MKRVIILGAGFAGLHAAFTLRRALPEVALRVVARSPLFLYRPDSIYVPFGLDPDMLGVLLNPTLTAQHIDQTVGEVTDLDATQRVVTAGGQHFSYDYLLIASGMENAPQQIPGLHHRAHDLTSMASLLALRRAFLQLVEDAGQGRHRRVVLLSPPGRSFAGPLYELALLLDTFLRRQDLRDPVEIVVATWEDQVLPGLAANDALSEVLAGRKIKVLNGWRATEVEPGQIRFEEGRTLSFDVLATLPATRGALRVRDLSYDENGFIRTDLYNRRARVEGQTNIFVAGDAADHPVKQGYVAFAQADVAAHHIISDIKGEAPTHYYEPRTRYIIDGFDTAIYIDSTLDDGPAFVGRSRLWHLSKQILGKYLPWKVRQGEPFGNLFDRPGVSATYPR
ncbi:MAG TPA: FAD-dependent oxidoreductase [Candidatus Xenobia bacterium]|jgi:sulfide:quinone oxidoreductase